MGDHLNCAPIACLGELYRPKSLELVAGCPSLSTLANLDHDPLVIHVVDLPDVRVVIGKVNDDLVVDLSPTLVSRHAVEHVRESILGGRVVQLARTTSRLGELAP